MSNLIERAKAVSRPMRRLLDAIANRLGYVHHSKTITGNIEWRREGPPIVDLRLPGGHRVNGELSPPWTTAIQTPPNPLFDN